MWKCKETRKLEAKLKEEKKKVSKKAPNGKGKKYIVIKDNVFIAWTTYNYGDEIRLETIDWLMGLVSRII